MAKKQSKSAKKPATKRRVSGKPVKSKAAKGKAVVKRSQVKAAKVSRKSAPKKVALPSKKKAAPKREPVKPSKQKFEPKRTVVSKVSAPIEEPVPAPEPEPAIPTRAPIRKIFGANNTVIAVSQKGAPLSGAQPEPGPEEEPKAAENAQLAMPEMPVFVSKAVAVPAPLVRVAWDDLPQSVPANVRFLVNSAIKESENASSSPFPFAKFISCLPKDLCGLEFGVLVLNLEHDPEEIARLCGFTTERVLGLIATGETAITDKFAALCPDMYRKWRAQFAGRTVSVEALIEHHLVAKVDKSFQALLAGVVLSAMGIKSPAFAAPLAAVNFGRVH